MTMQFLFSLFSYRNAIRHPLSKFMDITIDQQTTYRELDAQITRFAAGLQHLGLQKGDHIALFTALSEQALQRFQSIRFIRRMKFRIF